MLNRTRILAFAVLAIFLGSFAAQGAYALGLQPLTFSAQPTFSSLNSGFWQTVWLNQAGTKVYFLDSSGGSFKSVIVNATTGAIIATKTATMQGAANVTAAGPSAISAVETVGGINRIYYDQMKDTTHIIAGIINIDTGGLINTNTFAVTLLNSASNLIGIAATKNEVFYTTQDDGNHNFYAYNSTRALGSFASSATVASNVFDLSTWPHCATATDGSAASGDVVYCGLDIGQIIKITESSATVVATTACCSGANTAFLTDLSGAMVFQGYNGGPKPIYTITKATNAVSGQLYNVAWTTLTPQQFNFDGTTRTYKSAPSKAYFATTSKAIAWYPTTGTLLDPDALYVQTVNNSTATLTGLSGTYYRITDSFFVTGSGTTWTPQLTTGTVTQLAPTLYSEHVGVPLAANRTDWYSNAIKLQCDANYVINWDPLFVGTPGSCTNFQVGGSSSDTVGRHLSYKTPVLVHANPISAYNIVLESLNPPGYILTTKYQGTNVDNSTFPSTGNTNQYLLFGNCYTMSVTQISTGSTVTSANICADSTTTKTISLTGLGLPTTWLNTEWSYQVQRYFDNSTAGVPVYCLNTPPPAPPAQCFPTKNQVILSYQKNVNPFNASIYVTDQFFAKGTPRIHNWYNVTNASGLQVLNLTGFPVWSNETLYFSAYENGVLKWTLTSAPKQFPPDTVFSPATMGLWFGIPGAWFVPLVVAAIFPKSIAYFGVIAAVAVIGLMSVFGYLALPTWFWPITMPIVALAIFTGYKRT